VHPYFFQLFSLSPHHHHHPVAFALGFFTEGGAPISYPCHVQRAYFMLTPSVRPHSSTRVAHADTVGVLRKWAGRPKDLAHLSIIKPMGVVLKNTG
jgi:hypothetical protein